MLALNAMLKVHVIQILMENFAFDITIADFEDQNGRGWGIIRPHGFYFKIN